MIIAIDYDNTYTGDPITFNGIIDLFKAAGHTVVCVTGRDANSVMAEPVVNSIGKLVPIVFAGKEWKRDAAIKRGYNVNIWIDDIPEMVAKQILIGHG